MMGERGQSPSMGWAVLEAAVSATTRSRSRFRGTSSRRSPATRAVQERTHPSSTCRGVR